MKKVKHIIYFLQNVNDVLYCRKIYKIRKIENKTVVYRKKRFLVNLNGPNFFRNNTFYYFIDYDSGTYYAFNKIKTLNPELVDVLLSNNIVSQITRGFSDDIKKFGIFEFLTGLCIGAFIVYVIMSYMLMKNLQNTVENPPVIFGWIRTLSSIIFPKWRI